MTSLFFPGHLLSLSRRQQFEFVTVVPNFGDFSGNFQSNLWCCGQVSVNTEGLSLYYYDLGDYSWVTAEKIGKLGSQAHMNPASEKSWIYGDTGLG